MKLKTEIICKNFEQMKIVDKKIYTNEQSEEYYIVPLNKSFDLEYDDEVFKLTFTNQLLWLKYSNHWGYILLKEFDFNECVVIKSEDIEDIYVQLYTDKDCFIKKVWQSRKNVSLNKKFVGKFVLVLPIIEDMIDFSRVGEGSFYTVRMITNEILLKEVKNRGKGNGYIVIDNNVEDYGEALFVVLSDDDDGVGLFLE